jgi:hypothetical protein
MRDLRMIVLVVVALSAAVPRAQPSMREFCAVQVLVSVDDTPARSGIVELIDSTGRVVQTDKIANGEAEFCDFGFGRYSILIRDNSSTPRCGDLEIKNVRAVYGVTQKLRAVINDCGGEGDIGGNACATYVRVTSADGTRLKDVEINSSSLVDSEHTDRYGRAELLVHQGTHADFTFSKPGYRVEHLRLSCSSMLEGTTEASVVLTPEDRKKKW